MKKLRTNYLPAVGTVTGCLLGLAFIAPSALAQVTHTVTLSGATFSGGSFDVVFLPGDLPAGSQLLSVSVNAELLDTVFDPSTLESTFANDLTFYVGPNPNAGRGGVFTEGLLQVGGFSSYVGAVGENVAWADGNSPAPGTTVIDTVTSGADFASGIDLSAWTVYVGNGYNYPNTFGTWSGTIEITMAVVPEPQQVAALAGLGLVGFAIMRRQRRNQN